MSDFSLRNFRLDVSSREFLWEDGEAIVGIPLLKIVEVWVFQIFPKKGGSQFSHKKGGGITN